MCKNNADSLTSLVTSHTFSPGPRASWVAANPGRKLSHSLARRPLTAHHNSNSFLPHCAAHAVLGTGDQAQVWPVRWTQTGFVVAGFYKTNNESKTEGDGLLVDFYRSFSTKKVPVFSIGTTVFT